LTGALFAVELTGRFEALPHALACSAGAYAVSVLVMRRSILTEKIARRGRHVRQEFGVDPFELYQAGQIMTRNPEVLPATMTVREAGTLFAGRGFRSYPVVDQRGALIGMISRDDVLKWGEDLPDPAASLGEVLSDASCPSAIPQTPVGEVADAMVHTGQARLPIVAADGPDRGKVVGILTRHDLLKARHATRLAETSRTGLMAG